MGPTIEAIMTVRGQVKGEHGVCWVVLHGAGDDGSISHIHITVEDTVFVGRLLNRVEWRAKASYRIIRLHFFFLFSFSLFFGQPPLSTSIYYLLALRFPIMLGDNTQQ